MNHRFAGEDCQRLEKSHGVVKVLSPSPLDEAI
jgi:hypothetical protein